MVVSSDALGLKGGELSNKQDAKSVKLSTTHTRNMYVLISVKVDTDHRISTLWSPGEQLTTWYNNHTKTQMVTSEHDKMGTERKETASVAQAAYLGGNGNLPRGKLQAPCAHQRRAVCVQQHDKQKVRDALLKARNGDVGKVAAGAHRRAGPHHLGHSAGLNGHTHHMHRATCARHPPQFY